MQYLFRVDSSNEIGLGHFMRCLTLARYLNDLGQDSVFVSRQCLPFAKNLLQQNKIRLIELSPVPPRGQFTESYAEWLGVTQQEDADEVLQKTQGVDFSALIVDHYGINADWERRVKFKFNNLLVIDDLGRRHECDFLIDTTLNCPADKYKDSIILKNQFLGAQYGFLRKEIVSLRQKAFDRRMQKKSPSRLLLSMGNAGQTEKPYWALQALSKSPFAKNLQAEIVIGQEALQYKKIVEICQHNGFHHLHYQNQMADSLLNADVAIGAAGTSSYERACLGLPTLCIQTADNQKHNLQAFEEAKAALVVAADKEQDFIAETLIQLQNLFSSEIQEQLTHNSFRMINGLGLYKILKQAFALNPFSLRRANLEDCQTIFAWQSYPSARQFARNPNPPDWQEHQAWFSQALQNSNRDLWILQSFGIPLGFLRLDHSDRPEVSILINYVFWGSGLGKLALEQLALQYPDLDLYAYVSPKNKASLRIFLNSGYSPVGEDWYRRPHKK